MTDNHQEKSSTPPPSLRQAFNLVNKIHDRTSKQSQLQAGIILASAAGTVTAMLQNFPALAIALTNACFVSNAYMSRQYNTTLRDEFNEEFASFDEKTKEMLEPLNALLEDVEDWSLLDFDPAVLYKKERVMTVLSGLSLFIMPIFSPGMFAAVLGKEDQLKRIKLRQESENISRTMKGQYPHLGI